MFLPAMDDVLGEGDLKQGGIGCRDSSPLPPPHASSSSTVEELAIWEFYLRRIHGYHVWVRRRRFSCPTHGPDMMHRPPPPR